MNNGGGELCTHSGYVHQVIILQILRNTVVSPGAAANGNGRRDGIVCGTHGRLLNVKTPYRDQVCNIENSILVFGPDGAAVACALIFKVRDRRVHRCGDGRDRPGGSDGDRFAGARER